MRVEPNDAEALVPRREALDGADVGAAAPAQHERNLRQVGRDRERLCDERVLLDDGRFRIVERESRCLHHLLAAVTPGARHADETGGERAAAGVAFVPGPDGDRGVGAACRALGAKDAHRSYTIIALSTCMPTLS